MLIARAIPTFVGRRTRTHSLSVRWNCSKLSPVEPLSTTTIRAGETPSRTSASTQRIVSSGSSQFSTTAVRRARSATSSRSSGGAEDFSVESAMIRTVSTDCVRDRGWAGGVRHLLAPADSGGGERSKPVVRVGSSEPRLARQSFGRAAFVVVALALCLGLAGGAGAGSPNPPGFLTPGSEAAPATVVDPAFTDSVVFSGLTGPTAIRFAPDGQIFVAQKNGKIRVFSSLSATTPTTYADLSKSVDDYWDRGLLGLAIDPGWPARPYVYTSYTYDSAIGGAAPRWSDGCPTPPGPTTDGCVVSGRLAR